MSVHEQVLRAALRLCRARRNWTFRPAEVVAELPGLNSGSVRTHVMSRCCVNAPAHHPHRWPYFRRVGRGVYEILPDGPDLVVEAAGPIAAVKLMIDLRRRGTRWNVFGITTHERFELDGGRLRAPCARADAA